MISNILSLNKKNEKNRNNSMIPKKFTFYKTISFDIFNRNYYNNRACIFTYSNDNNIYIVYGSKTLDLEYYDIIKEKKYIVIKKIHQMPFESCREFYDKINNRNLILTSSFDEHVKVVNFKKEKSEIIIDLNLESNIITIINTACLINNKIVVPFSNVESGIIDLYNMNSTKIGKIEECGFILGLSGYYWKKIKKYFILVANLKGIIAYNEDNLSIYKKFIPKFQDEKEFNGFHQGYIVENNGLLKLFCPCFYYGYLFSFDFVNGCLINKISFDSGISDICIWDNKYIFVSLNKCNDYHFALINSKSGKIEKKFVEIEKDSKICGIKVIRSESKGDYLITFNMSGKLNLYIIKKPKILINLLFMLIFIICLIPVFSNFQFVKKILYSLLLIFSLLFIKKYLWINR